MAKMRVETDSLGEVQVPEESYYGAQTQRALENFPISGIRFSRPFLRALGLIKKGAAQANRELGLLDEKIAAAIIHRNDNFIRSCLKSYISNRLPIGF